MLKTTKQNMNKASKYDISINDIAELFGYASAQSFRSSSAYLRHLKAIDQLITLVEKRIIERIGN